jgi:hypothetical protein
MVHFVGGPTACGESPAYFDTGMVPDVDISEKSEILV